MFSSTVINPALLPLGITMRTFSYSNTCFLKKLHLLLLPFAAQILICVIQHPFIKPLSGKDVFTALQPATHTHTHSSSCLPRLMLEQRAHSWRRATRAEKKKKLLKNMMQVSVTSRVVLCVCACVHAAHFVTLLHLAKMPRLKLFLCFSAGHTRAPPWHLLCGCRKISFSPPLSSIV